MSNFPQLPWFTQIAALVEAVAVTAAALVTLFTINAWRKQNVGRRKVELAEQALMNFYQLSEVLAIVRRARQEPDGYPPLQAFEERRSDYYNRTAVIEGQTELISSLYGQQRLFFLYFGASGVKPFDALLNAAQSVQDAARWVFTGIPNVQGDDAAAREKLLSVLGWSNDARPDAIDRAVDQAIADLETVCEPLLQGRAA